MYESRRLMAYLALMAVGFMLWNAWQHDHPLADVVVSAAPATPSSLVPQITEQAKTTDGSASPHHSALPTKADEFGGTVPSSRLVTIENDVLRLVVDKRGGNFVKAYLKQYPTEKNGKQPVQILTNETEHLYMAQSGMTGPKGPDTGQRQVTYQSAQSHYVMQKGAQQLSVPLTYRNAQGIRFTKTLVLNRGHYTVGVTNEVDNRSKQAWQGHQYALLARKKLPNGGGFMRLPSYNGGSIWTKDKPYEKITYDRMSKDPVKQAVEGGWLAMQQRYFLSAWVPEHDQRSNYYSTHLGDDVYALGVVGPKWQVAPGTKAQQRMSFYVGPEDSKRLEALAPGLNLTIDYGFLWIISVAIFWVMQHIHDVIGNWGWSIVLVTLLIKAIFYYPSAASYKSMARMRALQPKMEALKKIHGDDKQKMGQATLELYRKEKANPLGGCLPMLIQMPFFFALYWVLIESVALRQAPFMGWIHDLSVQDPFYILPVLMAISMFVQQRMQPTPPDPTQAKVMMCLPLLFGAMFATFPAGLVLYWLTNNILSALQQWWVSKRLATAKAR